MKRQFAAVAVLTALSQLAAFFKLWFTARIYGVGSELDGYNLALVAPALIAGVVAGVLQTGFFPVRARTAARGSPAATAALERSVLAACLAAGLCLATLTWTLSATLADLIAPAGQTAVKAAFVLALPYGAALIALNIVTDCAGFILAMRNKFHYAAGAPIVNGLIGALALALWPQGGLHSLLLGTLVGAAAQLLVCVLGFHQAGLSLAGPVLGQGGMRHLRELLSLGAWVLPGVVFSNLVVSLPPLWAVAYGEGAVSAFGYAYRLHSSVVQLLVMASATLILARFSELIAQGQHEAVRHLLRRATWLSLTVGLAAWLAVWLLGQPLLLWLFGGRFDAAAAARVTSLWTWLTAGLGFSLLGNVFAKFWQAQSRPRLISVMAAASLATLCLCYYGLRAWMDESVITLALSAAGAAVALIGSRFLQLRPGIARP